MFAEFDKVVKCLALELPESVWDDVDAKYRSLKTKVEKFTSTNKAQPAIALLKKICQVYYKQENADEMESIIQDAENFLAQQQAGA